MSKETTWPDFRFTLEEISGAFGDSITVIPLLIGIGITTEASLAHLLLFFAIFQIATGLFYRLPVPVEPMKALAALVIAGTLSYKQAVAAGIVLGAMLLFTGTVGVMNWLDDFVPVSVVRGVQLGLAFILLKTSVDYVTKNIWLASIGIGIVILFLILKKKYGLPNISAFVVLILGAAIGIYFNGAPDIALMKFPSFSFPSFTSFPRGIILGALPQFFLSVGNAILATTLLFKDLLDRRVEPDRLSQSMGVMCIVSSLFGGFPACHGSGGLSGQYRFGARTGGSNLILGTIYLGIALIAGSATFLNFYPVSALGALLVFIALELASAGIKTDRWIVTLVVAILSFFTNLAIGFIVGLVLAKALDHVVGPGREP
ncbi:putative sulfate/molybdate transporter [Candidatus Bipolaricaulota bacterium]|nr:putative sulfate/molybdate transporter [Candidatus Bipolaricaulota bacterium]